MKLEFTPDGQVRALSIQNAFAEAQNAGLFQGLDRQQFSQLLNSVTGGNAFDKGMRSGLGWGTTLASEAVDDLVAWTGASQVTGDLGGQLGGLMGNKQLGRQVGETLPRQAVNLLPAAFGPLGIGAAVGLTSGDVYAQTGEADRAAFAGATTLAAPLVIGKMLPAVAGVVPGGQALGKALTSTTAGGTAARFGGNLVEGGVFGVAQDFGDILLAEDRKFSEVTTKDYWIEQAVGALAFAPFDAVQAYKDQTGSKVPKVEQQKYERQLVDNTIKDPVIDIPEPAVVEPKEVLDNPLENVGKPETLLGEKLFQEDARLETWEPTEVANMVWGEDESPFARAMNKDEGDGEIDYAVPMVKKLQDFKTESIEKVVEPKLTEIENIVPQTLEDVKTQLNTVNEVLDTIAETPVNDTVVRGEVVKQVELGEDVDGASQRAVQVLKNKTKKKLDAAKKSLSIDVPEEHQPVVNVIMASLAELGQDKRWKPVGVKVQQMLEKHQYHRDVIGALSENITEFYDSFKRTGMASVAGFKERLRKIESLGVRRGVSESKEQSGKVGVKGLNNMTQEDLDLPMATFNEIQTYLDTKAKPEQKQEVEKAYQSFVERASRLDFDQDVSLKGIRVMNAWWQEGGSEQLNVGQLKKEFNNALDKLKQEAVRSRARRGLVDSPGEAEVWQDLSVAQSQTMLDQGGFDAMLLRASENLEFYWNVPQYQVQANGQVKFGKLVSGKDGNVPLAALKQTVGFNGKQIKAGEVELWQQLVPEAFQGDKVNLKTLVEGLENSEPVVKVVEYGQEGVNNPAKDQFDQIAGELDIQGIHVDPTTGWLTVNGVTGVDRNDARIPETLRPRVEEALRLAQEARRTENSGPRATSYYNSISPFDTKQFPVRRIDVALPHDSSTKREPTQQEIVNTYGLTDPSKWRDYITEWQDRNKNPELWRQDDLHENLPNTLGWAMVQVVPDPRTGKNVMFVGEQQSRWGQEVQKQERKAKERADIWAKNFEAVAGKKPLPEAYNKKLAELQTELSNKNAQHPLLDIQHSLVLKAVIAEAKKQGIDTVVISDGESAMMTEKHDVAALPLLKDGVFKVNVNGVSKTITIKNGVAVEPEWFDVLENGMTVFQTIKNQLPVERKVSQAGGMRLHYDTTLPSEAKRLTQSEGELVDFGVHKNAIDSVNNNPEYDLQIFDTETAARTYARVNNIPDRYVMQDPGSDSWGVAPHTDTVKGSPVFRNPDGTPKASITGRAYPLNNISLSSNFLFGDRGQRSFGKNEAAEQSLLLHGETPSNARVLTPAVVQVAELFQQLTGRDIAIGTIVGGENKVSGLARDNPLRREVFLDPETHPDYQGFVAAHEMLGHTYDYLHEAGMLDADSSRHYTELRSSWLKSTAEERFHILRQLSDTVLPSKVKPYIDQLMETSAGNFSESLANFQALLAYGFTSKQNLINNFKFIPQPVLSYMIDFGRWFRRILNSTKTALGYRRLVGEASGETLKLAHDYSKKFNATLDALVKENNSQQRMMESMDMLMPGGYMRFKDAGVMDASLLTFEGHRALEAQADAFLLGDKISNFAEPILNKMERYPTLRHFSNVMRGEQGVANALLRTGELIMFGEGFTAGGRPIIPKDGGNLGRNIKDSVANTALNDAVIHAQLKDVSFVNLPDTDPDKIAVLQGLDQKQKADLLSSLKRMEQGTAFVQEAIIESGHRVAVTELGILLRKNLTGSNKEVQDIALGLYETFRKGRLSGNLQEFVNLANKFGQDVTMLHAWLEPVVNALAVKQAFFAQRKHYVTYRRMKQFQVVFDDKQGNGTERVDFHTEEEAAAFVKEAKTKGWDLMYPRTGYKDMRGRQNNLNKVHDDIEEALVLSEKKTIFPVLDKLLQAGKIDQGTYDALHQSREDFHAALSSENVEATIGKMTPARRFKKGYERLNMVEQHMMYLHKVSRALPRMETNAELKLAKLDPTIVNDLKSWQVLEEAERGLKAFRTPDTALGNKISKAMFGWYMGMNVSSALIEATQAPLNLSPKLVEEGASVAQAYSLPFDAASKIAKYNTTGKWNSGVTVASKGHLVDSYQVLLNRAEAEGLIGLGLQQEIRQLDYETMLDLGNLSAGNQAKGKGMLTTVVGQYMNLSSKLYGTFASFNEKLSFISAFDLKKEQLFPGKKSLTAKEFDQIYQEAARIVTVSNNNAGRIARPVGWFETEGSWRTASQMMYSLGSYNAGALSNLWRYVRHGMGKDIAGLTPQQQKQARKAGLMAFAHLVSAAGVIGGIPFMGPLMALLDEHTDWEVEKNLREGAYELGKEFNGQEGGTFVADFATHGLAYAMGLPLDISQRVAMNGVLGFNAFEGWSAKALLGPVGSVGQSLSDAAGSALKGDATGAVEAGLPPAFKRLWSLWANDGKVTDKQGKGILQPTSGEQAMLAMGFAPSRVTAFKESQRLQFKASRARQEDNERFHKEVSKIASTNTAQARQMLHKRAQENPGYSEAAGVDAVVDFLSRGKFGLDPNRSGSVQDAKTNMAILETFGGRFDAQKTSEIDFFTERTKLRAQMGQMPGDVHSGLLQAALVDRLVESRGLTVPAARAVAAGLTAGVDEQNYPLLDAFL